MNRPPGRVAARPVLGPPSLVRLPLTDRVATAAAILVPLAAVAALPALVWGWGFHWADLGLLAGMYLLTMLGITVGFHRLFVHRSFETYAAVKFVLAVLGSMAAQGPLFQWVATHRRHHQYSDRPDDPHTPHHRGTGVPGVLRGLWHAHVGWMFTPVPAGMSRYTPDLSRSPSLRAANALFPLWVILGLAVPAAAGGAVTGTQAGAWTGLVWGGLVRLFLVHHVTFGINSACHLWGRRPYRSRDQSRNNFLFGVLGLGEGWHNSHHAFPTSARHGLRWWQPDASYWVIRLLALAGLAWDVKLPSRAARLRERRTA